MDLQRVGTLAPKKHNSFYRYFHPYFTRLPGNVANRYIQEYSKKGETVLDPFCGSGVVGMESLLLGRVPICSDLSPLATFISNELLNVDVQIDLLLKEFEKIETNAKPLIKKIWSYGDENLYTGNPALFKEIENTYWYPKGELTYRSNVGEIKNLYDKRQLYTYAVLFDQINKIKNKSVRNTLLIVFFGVMSRANLTYMVSGSREGSVLHNGGSSIFSIYDYRMPKNVVVIPPWERFERKFQDIVKIKKMSKELSRDLSPNVIDNKRVFRADILSLESHLEENSIDYIFTDPPYGAKIPYLELSSMWTAWMGWSVTEKDMKSEIIEGGELDKSSGSYSDLLSESIGVMSKILKRQGSVSIVFQHADLSIWSALMESAISANLRFDYATVQPTNSATIIKKKFDSKVVSVPLIINFTKSRSNFSTTSNNMLNWKQVEKIIKKDSQRNGVVTYEQIYNHVTQAFISSGRVNDVIEMKEKLSELSQYFKVKDLSFLAE